MFSHINIKPSGNADWIWFELWPMGVGGRVKDQRSYHISIFLNIEQVSSFLCCQWNVLVSVVATWGFFPLLYMMFWLHCRTHVWTVTQIWKLIESQSSCCDEIYSYTNVLKANILLTGSRGKTHWGVSKNLLSLWRIRNLVVKSLHL